LQLAACCLVPLTCSQRQWLINIIGFSIFLVIIPFFTSGLAFLLPARKHLSFDEEGLSNQTHASKTLDQLSRNVSFSITASAY
jgi:hypothetical protein